MVRAGRDLKDYLVPAPWHEQGHLPLDRVAQSSIQSGLEHFQGRASAASLGNLCQCFTTLMVKNFLLISNLNLPSFSLQPFPLVLSLHTLVKSPSPGTSWGIVCSRWKKCPKSFMLRLLCGICKGLFWENISRITYFKWGWEIFIQEVIHLSFVGCFFFCGGNLNESLL